MRNDFKSFYQSIGISFNEPWHYVDYFEKLIAGYAGAPYGIAVDSCTHAIELCLRYLNPIEEIHVPVNTYLSIPMTIEKLELKWRWINAEWIGYYYLRPTEIIDAASMFRENMYIQNSLFCISFQKKKALPIGRGGMILTDNKEAYDTLQLMRYDGRTMDVPWAMQNVSQMGYHYYMTPEDAAFGSEMFHRNYHKGFISNSYENYPDLSKMKVFDK